MVQIPKRNLPTNTTIPASEASPSIELPMTVASQKKTVKSCRQTLAKCVTPVVQAIETEKLDPVNHRKPWGRSRSFDEPTERIPIALPVTLTQALRLKAVVVKKTPSQIIAELLRAHL
jgi:hypothetical protein